MKREWEATHEPGGKLTLVHNVPPRFTAKLYDKAGWIGIEEISWEGREPGQREREKWRDQVSFEASRFFEIRAEEKSGLEYCLDVSEGGGAVRPEREPHVRWQAFAKRFGLTKAGAVPWDPETLVAQYDSASAGERHIIAFLLRTWDPGNKRWPRFDLHAAVRDWSGVPRPLLEWLSHPWWP